MRSARHLRRAFAVVAPVTAASAAASSSCSASLDPEHAQSLSRRWVEQESRPGYVPPSASWPPPVEQPPRSSIPMLQGASGACGGADTAACHRVTFSLAVALLGAPLFGHSAESTAAGEQEPTDDERAQGAALMRQLAERGMLEGLCGWALCLLDGAVAPQDAPHAMACHRAAAAGGLAQSMHELGVIYYTGELSEQGVPADAAIAVRWLRLAAEGGVSGSMYLLGECLLEGSGCTADEAAAFRWFEAAGELGHRGARQRILEAVRAEDGGTRQQQRYAAVAGRRGASWGTA